MWRTMWILYLGKLCQPNKEQMHKSKSKSSDASTQYQSDASALLYPNLRSVYHTVVVALKTELGYFITDVKHYIS